RLTQEQIAREWRGSYDLLLRPSSAVSQPERDAGWINPQSLLETYGGITPRQMAVVASLAHVSSITPLATAGWQPITVQMPLELPHQAGIYRVSVGWNELQPAPVVATDYIEVTDLAHLTNESPPVNVSLHYVLLNANPVYQITLQALQAIVGIPSSARTELSAQLEASLNPLPSARLLLHLDQLQAPLADLSRCLNVASCWSSVPLQPVSGALTSQADGVQLWRFSPATYTATPGQLASGESSLVSPGSDAQGTLYRLPQPGQIAVPDSLATTSAFSASGVLPFALAQHLPLLPAAIHLLPLDQVCELNGPACYSGLYVRLNGAEHYSQQSLALLQSIAGTITARTGLHVDILDGSSLRQVTIQLPSPHSSLTSTWRTTGVAVQIVHSVDALQSLLLAFASLVCLLAFCSAGIQVGVGRRKEMLFLSRVGWSRSLLGLICLADALLLACPGLLLVSSWLLLFARFSKSTLPLALIWCILAAGLLAYSLALVLTSCHPLWEKPMRQPASSIKKTGRVAQWISHVLLQRSHLGRFSAGARASSLVTSMTYLALTAAVFLIALTFLLIENLNRSFAVTVLGSHVSTVLALPHLVLFGVILGAALLTLVLSTHLRLRARLDEFHLLASLGWERRHVLWHLLKEMSRPGLICGALGTGLALVLLLPNVAFSSWLALFTLCLTGPLCGLAMAGIVTGSLTWSVSRRFYPWR
ncbi:MAG TPA: FtsX-like permease family protein, partial [Ktedonobacteraceae bacterium]